MGAEWSLAWRVFDAQFWGVPQRRKRIALVADFGGESAPEILFERKSLSWNPNKSRPEGKAIAESAQNRSAGNDRMVEHATPINMQIATRYKALGERTGLGIGQENDPAYTLQAGHEHGVCYCISGNTVDRETNQNGTGVRENGSFTVNTVDRHAVAYAIDCRNLKSIKEASDTLQAAIFDARGNGDGKIVPTITGDHENRITDYTAIAIERQTFNEQSSSRYKESDNVLEGKKKLVIFARFIPEVLEIIKRSENIIGKSGMKTVAIYGAIPKEQRGDIVQQFQKDPSTMVLVGQIDTAGTGITLTAADTCVYYSVTFNYATYSQSLARIHRIGQRNTCTYIHLVAENTVDSTILKSLSKKEDLAKTVVDDWRQFF